MVQMDSQDQCKKHGVVVCSCKRDTHEDFWRGLATQLHRLSKLQVPFIGPVLTGHKVDKS